MRKLNPFSLITLVIVFTVLILSGCQTVSVLPESVERDDYSTVKSALNELIKVRMKKQKIVGMNIAIVNDGELFWSEGFGYTDKEARTPVSADTPFFMGSVSKLFTATAVMQLVEQGVIDLNAPIDRYIPGFSIKSRFPDSAPITVKDLLTHHSGLPSDILKGWWLSDPPPEDYKYHLYKLPGALAEEYTFAPPGEFFAYCNVGFSLLGIIVANVSGMDFDLYVKENVLKPLGMEYSSFMADDLDALVTKGYQNGKIQPRPYIRDYPAGSLVSGANDMAKFMNMILSGGKGVLAPETFEMMITRQNGDVALDLDFSIGITYWLIDGGLPVEKTASHGGDIPPYHGMMITVPEYGIGVSVAVNTEEGAAFPRELAMEAVRLMLEAKEGIKVEPKVPSPKKVLTEAEIAALSGMYAGPVGYAKVKPKGRGMVIDLMGQTLYLVPREDGTFNLEVKLLGFIPVKVPQLESFYLKPFTHEGKRLIALYVDNMYAGFFEKYEPVEIPDSWRARTGVYEVVDADVLDFLDAVELKYDKKDGVLLFSLIMMGQKSNLLVVPVSDTEIVGFGRGRNMGATATYYQDETGEYISILGFKAKRK